LRSKKDKILIEWIPEDRKVLQLRLPIDVHFGTREEIREVLGLFTGGVDAAVRSDSEGHHVELNEAVNRHGCRHELCHCRLNEWGYGEGIRISVKPDPNNLDELQRQMYVLIDRCGGAFDEFWAEALNYRIFPSTAREDVAQFTRILRYPPADLLNRLTTERFLDYLGALFTMPALIAKTQRMDMRPLLKPTLAQIAGLNPKWAKAIELGASLVEARDIPSSKLADWAKRDWQLQSRLDIEDGVRVFNELGWGIVTAGKWHHACA